MSHAPDDERSLDPMAVNYAAWSEVRRHVRSWPTYKEVPNRVEVSVSPDDWDEYWGIDTERNAYEVHFDGMDTPRSLAMRAKLEKA